MCSFLIFNYYAVGFPKKGVYPIKADIFLGINILLLLLVLLISAASQILFLVNKFKKSSNGMKKK